LAYFLTFLFLANLATFGPQTTLGWPPLVLMKPQFSKFLFQILECIERFLLILLFICDEWCSCLDLYYTFHRSIWWLAPGIWNNCKKLNKYQ
jgi:hypothetical protein